MTSFEFVFGLISVITSLALTQMLSGVANLIRHAKRVRLSWRHGLWVVTAFMLLIANWAALWRFRDQHAWSALDVLAPLVFVSVLYAFCDLVMPEKAAEHALLDLRDYHLREGKRYKLMQLAFAALSLLMIAREVKDFDQWLSRASFAIIAALIGVIALRARSVWLDTATAAALALLGIAFMTNSLRIVST
ncbi:MAG: hypothetical protein ABI379_12640 [Rhodanobacter sp.]